MIVILGTSTIIQIKTFPKYFTRPPPKQIHLFTLFFTETKQKNRMADMMPNLREMDHHRK